MRESFVLEAVAFPQLETCSNKQNGYNLITHGATPCRGQHACSELLGVCVDHQALQIRGMNSSPQRMPAHFPTGKLRQSTLTGGMGSCGF